MNHSEARKKVCIICYHKASRSLSSLDIEAVQQVVIENFNHQNTDFPCALNALYHAIFTEHRKENTKGGVMTLQPKACLNSYSWSPKVQLLIA